MTAVVSSGWGDGPALALLPSSPCPVLPRPLLLVQTTTDYIHRIGRTGRAGRAGEAITLFTEEDSGRLRGVANVMRAAGCEVPQWMLTLRKERGRWRGPWEAPLPAAGISTEPRRLAGKKDSSGGGGGGKKGSGGGKKAAGGSPAAAAGIRRGKAAAAPAENGAQKGKRIKKGLAAGPSKRPKKQLKASGIERAG